MGPTSMDQYDARKIKHSDQTCFRMAFCWRRLRCRKFSLFRDSFMHDTNICTNIWWPAADVVIDGGGVGEVVECWRSWRRCCSNCCCRLCINSFGFRGPRFACTECASMRATKQRWSRQNEHQFRRALSTMQFRLPAVIYLDFFLNASS